MAVKGLHHIITEAPDPTIEWLVTWRDLSTGQSGSFLGAATPDELLHKTKMLLLQFPESKGFSFKFPDVHHLVLIYVASGGELVVSSSEL